MENHYRLIREIRRKMRLVDELSPDDMIDYYWSLHRLHEHQAKVHNDLASKNNDNNLRHLASKERHFQKALEYGNYARSLEEKAYPGFSEVIEEI